MTQHILPPTQVRARPKCSAKTFYLVARNTQLEQVQCPFPEPGQYTVQFGSPSIQNIWLEADVTWFCAGNSIKRTVTVADGVSVTGVGESVNVVLRDRTGEAAALPGFGAWAAAGTQYSIGVQVSPGTRATTQNPPSLLDLPPKLTFGTGTSNSVDVPKNSGVRSIFVSVTEQSAGVSLTPGKLEVSFLNSGGEIQSFDPILVTGWVPIPAGTLQVNFSNNSGGTVEFAYTWGIDG